MKLSHKFALFLASLALLATPGWAQMQDNTQKSMECDHHNNSDRLVNHCEIQEQTLAASRGTMEINPGVNGGVTVKGWSRGDVLVRSRIDTWAPNDSEARAIVPQIRTASGSGMIKASGPEGDEDHHWSVTYEIFVPHQTDVSASTNNGGVHIQDIKGKITFQTLNGGVHLARLAGEVEGRTTNGGVHVELAGDHWDGPRLDVETTNGGVKLMVPTAYSAHVETSTVNGGVSVDFPITLRGQITKQMSFDLGSGGATVRVVTTNGGVKIQHS